MKNFILSFLVCFPAVLSAQNESECFSAGDPPAGGCCFDCTCYTCADAAICENNVGPLGDYANCVLGGCENCGTDHPSDLCDSWTWNYYGPYQNGIDQGCVPIDGGLGFLIAGGLGMGVLGVRRRKELELEA